MCGIAGFTQYRKSFAEPERVLRQMGDSIQHRGPDGAGYYCKGAIGLCHRRLSIIDLSESGDQPMISGDGRFVLVFNGEIYNFQSLRNELIAEGVSFRGHSDSEVLLALYQRLGADCLSRLNGMFAFAVWDSVEESLFLARDRLGKKPLYYYDKNGAFVFASEIKSILSAPEIDRSLRTDAIRDYFNYQYVPDPKSIFRYIHKLAPGHWMHVDRHGTRMQRYWDLSFDQVTSQSCKNLEEDLYQLIEDSVRLRMISDVPLGAFLSGGVDSSAVVGMMAGASASPVTSCSIGFNSREHDEVDYARRVANRFNTQHHEFTVTENVQDSLLSIAASFDEPFADASFIPTWFVSRLARQKVTVALAGDGGDESFAGYRKYLHDRNENTLRNLIPSVLRHNLLPILHRRWSNAGWSTARRAGSLAGTLSEDSAGGFAISNSFFNRQLWDMLALNEFKSSLKGYDTTELTRKTYYNANATDHLSRILYTDINTYLPGDILVKVDRMSMVNSLETRAPLLDYRVVELAATIPSTLKLHGKEGKHLLKRSMSELLEHDTLYRRKMGFSVPLRQWLRKEIRETVGSYLFRTNSGLSQYFDIQALRSIWNLHQQGRRDCSQELWSLFMFEVWWQNYMESK